MIPTCVFAQQDENWDVYLARYEKGTGSTSINMAAKLNAPDKSIPYVVITGVTFTNCTAEGFPTKKQFEELYIIEDTVASIIDKKSKSLLVGTFTYQCERLNYFYVADTTNIRAALENVYQKSFPDYKPYINIKNDYSWDAYLSFLYPNEETREYIKNQKVVSKLEESGDKLEKSRKVDHWLYFKTAEDRNCAIQFAIKSKFKIENKSHSKDSDHPFGLQISRTDKVDIENITRVTLALRKEALKCNGIYDGWETFVVD